MGHRVNESLADVLAEEEPEEPAVQLAVLRQRLEQQKVNSIGLRIYVLTTLYKPWAIL